MILFDGNNFSLSETLECGQVFRFERIDVGQPFSCVLDCDLFEVVDEYRRRAGYPIYISRAEDKVCYCFEDEKNVCLVSDDEDYFYNYFDLDRDYEYIANEVKRLSKKAGFDPDLFPEAVDFARGIRILNQSPWEALISFIISQNNNIPRIKGIIRRLCAELGERTADGGFAFPTPEKAASRDKSFYSGIGLGYRDSYVLETAKKIRDGYRLSDIFDMDADAAAAELRTFKGVGEKVADCILLFGFHKTDSFPVDVWIDRAYRKMGGVSTDRKKIRRELVDVFGDLSGYAQQYLFNYFIHNPIFHA